MKTSVRFYNSETDKTHFELQSGIRPWGILMLITEGSYTIKLPETEEFYTLTANTVSYIPPNTPFIRKVEKPIHFHQFHLQCEAEDFLTGHLHPGTLPIPKEQVGAIAGSLRQLNAIPPQPELLQHILEYILTENYIFSFRQRSRSRYSEDVFRALCYMEQHLTEEFKLTALAEIAGLSPTGLIWKFHQQLQTTPQQHFIHLRIQRAKELLVETSLSITEIAEKCGYSDLYYFSNAFRKNTGISPSGFRKSPRI